MKTAKHHFSFRWPGGLRLVNEKDYFAEPDWDDAIFRAIAAAAERFVPGFELGEGRFEEQNRENRDDNGGYAWDNSYKRGSAEHHILIRCQGYRGEDLMYPTPMSETRDYKAGGLKGDQKIEVSVRYGECAVRLTSMRMSVSIEGEAAAAAEAKERFIRDFGHPDVPAKKPPKSR